MLGGGITNLDDYDPVDTTLQEEIEDDVTIILRHQTIYVYPTVTITSTQNNIEQVLRDNGFTFVDDLLNEVDLSTLQCTFSFVASVPLQRMFYAHIE